MLFGICLQSINKILFNGIFLLLRFLNLGAMFGDPNNIKHAKYMRNFLLLNDSTANHLTLSFPNINTRLLSHYLIQRSSSGNMPARYSLLSFQVTWTERCWSSKSVFVPYNDQQLLSNELPRPDRRDYYGRCKKRWRDAWTWKTFSAKKVNDCSIDWNIPNEDHVAEEYIESPFHLFLRERAQ